MVPRVAKAGRSFKGAAKYYLHDRGADTSDRVTFVEILNVPTRDPHRATAHMIDTATHADLLKREAGLKGGRKLEKPVYSYSLSWHPSENPSQEEQITAAKETLKVLGLEDHQALIVAHNDRDHPHVHIIVNRVHPETGRAAVMSNDQLKLSGWAEDYERKHGHILCPQRVANNDNRRQRFVKHDAQSRRQHYEWKRAASDELWSAYRKEKEIAHSAYKPRFQTLWDQRNARIATDKARLKADYKEKWRDLYQSQRKALHTYDNRLTARLKYAARQTHSNRMRAFLSAVVSDGVMRAQFIRDQQRERGALSAQQLHDINTASRQATDQWVNERDTLRASINDQNKDRLEDYKERSDDIWKTPAGSASEAQKRAREAAERKLKSDAQRRKRKRFRGPSP